MERTRLVDTHELDVALQLTEEGDFTYFCKYDDLTGVIASPNAELPSIANSCYVDRCHVFLPPRG